MRETTGRECVSPGGVAANAPLVSRSRLRAIPQSWTIQNNMTGDELAARLYSDQGYLVVAGTSPRAIGDILKENSAHPERSLCNTPLRVVALSCHDELERQVALVQSYGLTVGPPVPAFRYYYRVEAAD